MAAGIHVDPIPVCVDLDVVDSEIVYARRQDREMPAHQHGDVANRYVPAKLQGDRLVANALVGGPGETLAVNQPWPYDRDVFEFFPPDQAVVEIGMTEVLELGPLFLALFDRIVDFRIRRGLQGRPLAQKQCNVAPQVDRTGNVGSGREVDGSSARRTGRRNRVVDRGGVERIAVASRAVRLDAKYRGWRLRTSQAGYNEHSQQDVYTSFPHRQAAFPRIPNFSGRCFPPAQARHSANAGQGFPISDGPGDSQSFYCEFGAPAGLPRRGPVP